MNFSDLITYFESLACQHIHIRHTEQEKHFFRFEVDELLAGINRTDVNYPLLVFEGYNFDFTDQKNKKPKGIKTLYEREFQNAQGLWLH